MLILWGCIGIGSLLRLVWPLDFEWKFDEKWMFQKAERLAHGLDPWPWVGMSSGVGMENPGGSVWAFAALAQLTDTPEGMTRAVGILNVLALWGFAAWVIKVWPEQDRAVGLSGIALFAISPLPVVFSRKIWAQDLLPVLLVPWLFGHSLRHRAWPAFMFGVFSALLGQLHLSGFFAAAALLLATLLLDRARTRWLPIIGGGLLGGLPLVPWLLFLLSGQATPRPRETVWSLDYFWDAFVTAWGIGLRYSLRRNFGEFLRSPRLGELNSWLVGGAHIALGLLAVGCAIMLGRKLRSLRLSKQMQVYAAAVVLGGVLLHGLGVKIYVHYLIVFSPLLHVGVAWMLLQQRGHWLMVCMALQLYITASFLWFIHTHGGAPDGEFGISYGAQTEEQRRQDLSWPVAASERR